MKANSDYWNGKRVLITGITGMAGSWLAEALVPLGAKVTGIVRRHAVPNFDNLDAVIGKVSLVGADLSDMRSLYDGLKKSEAEVVFHLAAQSFVPQSFRAPIDTYTTNVIGTVNVLEAVRLYDGIEKMQFAGSSEEYGLVLPDEVPIRETNPLRPLSPYAVSKVAGDFACYNHFKSYGVPVVRTRGFNHTGPRRGQSFVTATVARQAAEMKLGKRDAFELGNMDAKRDFSDVRDIVLGYMLAVEKAEVGEVYNLCSGNSVSVKELVELACKLTGVANKVRQDPAKMRPSDVPVLQGDCTKAQKAFGYAPSIPFEKTFADLLEWQTNNVKSGKTMMVV